MASRIDRDLIGALPRLRRYALALTRERDAAQDLVQQTALRALTASSPPVGPAAILPWLLTIARNAFIDECRRTVRQGATVLDADQVDDGESGWRTVAIRQALARLDPDCRAVIDLVDVRGCTYVEAAKALAVPVGTVMSRLSRARRKLLADLTLDEDRP